MSSNETSTDTSTDEIYAFSLYDEYRRKIVKVTPKEFNESEEHYVLCDNAVHKVWDKSLYKYIRLGYICAYKIQNVRNYETEFDKKYKNAYVNINLSSPEVQHIFNCTKSITSSSYRLRILDIKSLFQNISTFTEEQMNAFICGYLSASKASITCTGLGECTINLNNSSLNILCEGNDNDNDSGNDNGNDNDNDNDNDNGNDNDSGNANDSNSNNDDLVMKRIYKTLNKSGNLHYDLDKRHKYRSVRIFSRLDIKNIIENVGVIQNARKQKFMRIYLIKYL
jgi:hypothetical protein